VLDDVGFDSEQFRPAAGPTQPSIQWILGFFPVVKRPGREVYQSPPSLEVKNYWSNVSASLTYRYGEDKENLTIF
jgi:hypothetical protein